MAKSDSKLLTQAEYARSRKARGLSGGSREAVRKAVDEQRISAFGPNKLIDQDLADHQWGKNTRVRISQSAPAAGAPAQPELLADADGEAPVPQARPAPAEPPSRLHDDPGYLQSRSEQAAVDLRMSKLELAKIEKELVLMDAVRIEMAGRLTPVREGLLQIPARLAPVLAAQSDAGRIQTLLDTEIHQVLSPLTRWVDETPDAESKTP